MAAKLPEKRAEESLMQALDSLRGMLDKPAPAAEPPARPESEGPVGSEIPILTEVVSPGAAQIPDTADRLATLRQELETRIDEALQAASRSMSEELKRQLQDEVQGLLQAKLGDSGRSRR